MHSEFSECIFDCGIALNYLTLGAIIYQEIFEKEGITMTRIDIFSGFLGAGKTTLIKKMIKESFTGEKIVLIENEFGEIGIDGGFLKDAGIEITEMNSGCICCSLVGDFGEALKKVIDEYHPDRILIEPSGVGKLSDVIVAVQKAAENEAVLGSTVAVADATKCKMYMKNFGEFYNNQIETASCIVLSRTDAMPEEKLNAAVALIREHNSHATIVTTPWNALSGAQLLDAMEQHKTLKSELERMMAEHDDDDDDECCCCCHDDDDEDGDHEHHHHHHHHDEEDGEHEHHHHHHHDEEDGEHEHHHHHHHDEEDGEHDHHHHHHHENEEGEHEHHHHHHDEDGEHEHHHHHHHHHDADEVFTSWGRETARKYTEEEIRSALAALDDAETYGIVLRAKGIVAAVDGSWIHFDHVPGEADVRKGSAEVTGRLCVIGSKLNEEAIAKLFGV